MKEDKVTITPLDNPTEQDDENWRRLLRWFLYDEPLVESSTTADVAKAS